MNTDAHAAKKAYFAKVRRRNYQASLRLEGFDLNEMNTAPSSKAATISQHYKKAAG